MSQQAYYQSYETQRVLKDFASMIRTLTQKTQRFDEKQGYLKELISKQKVNNLVSGFIQKMKRKVKNTAKPISIKFTLEESKQQIDNQRFFKAQGYHFPQWFQVIVLALDIVFCIVILLLSTFQTLLEDYRDNYRTTPPVIALKAISTLIFILRIIILVFNIQYQTDKTYKYISDLIVKEFLDGSLIIHPLCLIMVILAFFINDSLTFDIIFLVSAILKFFILGQDIDYLELILLTSSKRYYIWNLIKVLVFNIIFAHFLVIILLSIKYIDNNQNWVIVKLVSSEYIQASLPWLQLYFWAYYWACTIMMTIGFGDISAVTYKQAIVIAFIQIFSVLILAYNINFVGNVVDAMKKPKILLDRKLGIIHRMVKNNPIPRQLQGKIQNYLTHQMEMKDNFQYEQHRQIIEGLPQQLKNEYYQSANQIVFENLPFFWHLQSATLLKISLAFKGKIYYPSQYFIKRSLNKINDVIIVRSGIVAFQYFKQRSKLNGNKVQSIEIKSPQKPFQITNFTNKFFEINYNIVAETYCYSLSINKGQLIDILRESNLDYYYYLSMMDRHERDLGFYYYTKCQYCSVGKYSQFHTKFICPKLHYTYQKQHIILNYLHQFRFQKVKRKQSKRKIFKKHIYNYRNNQFKALENQKNVLKAILETFYNMWDCDMAYDYPNYFKNCNVKGFSGLSLKKREKQNLQAAPSVKQIFVTWKQDNKKIKNNITQQSLINS